MPAPRYIVESWKRSAATAKERKNRMLDIAVGSHSQAMEEAALEKAAEWEGVEAHFQDLIEGRLPWNGA